MTDTNAAWTVMVYLAGDNNLTTECMFALTEMRQANIGKNLNVIAQFDPSDPYLPTHRYEIQRCGKKKGFHHDIVDRACYLPDCREVKFTKESDYAEELEREREREQGYRRSAWDDAYLTGSPEEEAIISDDTDSGSPVTLYNFISFCIQYYPADHYLVVLSGHAGGTERDYLMKDESSSGSLTFKELKKVFQRVRKDLGRPIDIIGMDNCLMSMAEICYELRGQAEIVIGCESFSPASGWPYREVLERLAKDFATPCLRPNESVIEAAARAIVKEYVNYYANYWLAGLSVTQSALNVCKVERLHELVTRMGQLMEALLIEECGNDDEDDSSGAGRQFHDALLLAHWEAQSYNGEQFVDLYDFCDCLEARLGDSPIAEQCRLVKEFLTSEFVLTSCYSGPAYQYSYGVSLYFPWSQVTASYFNLDFVKNATESGWGSFLRTYTLLTRRAPRGGEAQSELTRSMNGTAEAASEYVRMSVDRMGVDRMGVDRMGVDRMGVDRMENPRHYIHSMRNPPNVFFPDHCIRKRRHTLAVLEMLRLK